MNNEDEVQEFLYTKLREKGWKVEREVPTDESKDKQYPFKIDIVIFKSDYQDLNPMGIEVKYIKGIRQGSRISEAMDQIIFKYGNSHFKGLELKTTCVAIYYNIRENRYEKNIINSSHILTKGLLTYWGIGYINLNENPLRIQFGADNQNDMKILINYKSNYTESEYRDVYKKKYIPDENKILKKSEKWKNLLIIRNSGA